MYQYNAEQINNSIAARRRIAQVCKGLALKYSPVPLPPSVINRIYSRKKLYNFLESIDLSHESITAIFWQYNMAVPRDTKLKQSMGPKPEPRAKALQDIDNYNNGDFHI